MKQFTATVGGNYQVMNYTAVPSVTACSNGTPGTGTITITGLTGGNPPYRYRLFTPTTSAFQNNNTFTGLTPGTTYQVQVFDACENFQTRQVQIPAIAAAGLPNPNTLFENCDGTVRTTYSATGGNTPYTYQVTAGPTLLNTTNTTGVFNFNTSSSYTVKVTDNCGGTATRTFATPGKPNQQLFLQGAMGSACTGGGGGVAIRVRNGIPPYTGIIKGKAGSTCASFSKVLNLSRSGNGDYTETVMGLSRPCMYVVTVTDKCGNESTEELNLVAIGNEQLKVNDNILCPTSNSTQYRLQLTVSLGPPYSPRANYTFNLFNSSNQQVSGFPKTQSGTSVTVELPAGTYKYQVLDACNTTSKLGTVVIAAYANPTVRVDLTTQCINTGQARLITTSQNPLNSANPAFKITAGPNRVGETNNTGIFSNLRSGGTYTFEFNDGCKTVKTNTTLPPYQQPTFEVAYGVICSPETVATLQAVGLSGTVVQPYKFEIISFNTTGSGPQPEQSDSTFTNLTAGQYNVRGFDGCNNSFTFLGKVGPIPAPKIQLDANPACEGTEVKVRPDVFVFGATYTISRNDTVIYTGPKSINTLPAIAGDYKIKIQVPGGCNATSPAVKLNIVGKLAINNPAEACAGTTVNLTAAAVTAGSSTGTLAYFQDENATLALDGTTGPANAIKKAGDYYIRLTTTSPSCVTTKKVTVAFKATPATPTATPTQPTCTTATGLITVTAPATGVTYSFNNGSTYQAGNVSGALNSGTYQVKGTNECVSAATAVILNAQPATPVAPAIRTIQPTCEVATGIIVVTAPPSATEFSFDNGATFQTSSSSDPLAAGTYSIKVKNADGCTSDLTAVVIDPQPATPDAPTATVVSPTCEVATGKITVTGSTNIINYSFDNGATYQADSVSAALVAGVYSVKVQNAEGCFSDFTKITIDPQPATPTLSATDKTCADDLKTYSVTFTSDGEVTASLGTVDNVAKTVSDIPADLTVTLTASANGCQRVVEVTAPDCSCPSIAPPVVTTPEITICEGQTIPAFTATVGERQKAIWYDAPTGGNVLLDNSLTYTPTGAGVFYVEAADLVSDCRSTSRVKVELIVNPQPVLTIGTVTCRQSGLFYDVAYTATPGAVVSADKGFVTDTTIQGVPAGTAVKIMVTLNGCKDSTTVTQTCALPYGSLGDFVWQDTNANGQQDTGEPGIENALVYLLDDNGAILDSTRTNASGRYGFDSLASGNYQVKFFLPEGYDGFTKIRVPGSDTLDSDADAAGLSQFVSIDTSEDSTSVLRNNPTIDAGITRLGSIGDFVWEDKNNDGIQTSGEPGIVGVTVYLLDASGVIIDSTLTKAGGKYLFDSLTAGTYQVQFVAPTGYDGFTQPNQGDDPTKDSNVGTDGKSQRITIDVTRAKTDTLRNNPTIDAGVISPCIQPIISSTQVTAATCNGKTANADARFTLRGLSNGDRYTFAATEAALLPYATAMALDADSIQVSGLANPDATEGQTYFVRIYDKRQGCFKDTTVLVPFRDCGTVCVQPQAGPDVFVCKPATTTDLPDALSYEEWVVSPKNESTATIDPVTGAVSGLNESGIYAFILRDKTLGSTCADTVVVFRGVLDLPNQTSCEDTLTLPAVAGATYSLAQGNTATITPEGRVSGLTTVGTIYEFLVTNGQCADTIRVERLRCTLIYDLALAKTISKKLAMLGDTLTYTIKVFNQGEGVVHGIEVTDSLNAGVQYLGSVAETGSFSFATRHWSFDSLAVGDTATLSISVRVIAQGPWFNTAEITKMTEEDEDSTPGNGEVVEDDIDRECFTVPALICRGQGQSTTFKVPAQYTGVVWFRKVTGGPSGGDAVKVGEGNTYTAQETELGSYEYTFTSTNGTCPATGCCPAIVLVQDCCPAEVCVPFVIEKRVK